MPSRTPKINIHFVNTIKKSLILEIEPKIRVSLKCFAHVAHYFMLLIFYNKKKNNGINHIHERVLEIFLKNYILPSDLIRKEN